MIDGQILCQQCGRLISIVDTSPLNVWIDSEVDRKQKLMESGELQTRIQTHEQNDQDIARDGLHAEFAACVAMCPRKVAEWQASAASNKKNRGCDFPMDWTHLRKPIEVKFTRSFGQETGYLLIRPPANEGSKMKEGFVDDAIFVLLTGKPSRYKILGWIDRDEFVKRKQVDPVGRKAGQVECWGVLWKNLIGLSQLPRTQAVNLVEFTDRRRS